MSVRSLSRRALLASTLIPGACALGAAIIGAPGRLRAQTASSVGQVEALRGSATAARGGTTLSLRLGASIAMGDRITTGEDTRLRIRLSDGTVFTLGDGTDLVIDEFVFNPRDAAADVAFQLTKGVFRMLTGASAGLANASGGAFRVRTPVATIGVRGTDFWGQQSADRLDLALLEGGPLEATTPLGSVLMTEAPFVTVIDGQTAPTPPRRLSAQELARAASTVAF